MPQSAATYPFHLRAGAIKRVVRRGMHFLCGLCRSPYDHEGQAVGCLSECWQELLKLDPILTRRHGARLVFRCRFCARDFLKRGDAAACAVDCRDHQQVQHDAAMAVLASDDITPAARQFKRRKPVTARLVAPPKKRKTPPQATVQAAPEPTAPAPMPAEIVAVAAPVEAPVKKKGGKPFFRDGAEYVCTVCSKHYFTKLEVTACFDSH